MDEFTTEVLAMMRARIINQRSLETRIIMLGAKRRTDLIGYSRSRLLELRGNGSTKNSQIMEINMQPVRKRSLSSFPLASWFSLKVDLYFLSNMRCEITIRYRNYC